MSSNYQTTLDQEAYFKHLKRILSSKSCKFTQISSFCHSNPSFFEAIQKSLRRSSNMSNSSSLMLSSDSLLKSLTPLLASVFKSNELWLNSLTNLETFTEVITILHFSLFLSVNFGLEIELPLNKCILYLQNSMITVGVLNFKKSLEKQDKNLKISGALINNELYWDFFSMVLYLSACICKENTSIDHLTVSLVEENKKYRQMSKMKGMDLEKSQQKQSHRTLKVILGKRLLDIIALALANEATIFQENKKNIEKSKEGFNAQTIQSMIKILRKIFEDVQKNLDQYSLRNFNDRAISILQTISKKPQFFEILINSEANEKTSLFKVILDLFYKELIRPERKASIDQGKTLPSLIDNLNSTFEIFTTGTMMGLLKDLESIFLVFIIKLFDPKTVKNEIFLVLFDHTYPILTNYLKIVFNLIDKDLIISTLIPIIFFESLEPKTQKTFKDFFYLIKEMSLSENQVSFMRILITSISLKSEFSQEIVNSEELLMIFDEYILNMNEKEYIQLADELAFLINEFFLKFNEVFMKKELLKNDIIKTFGKLFKEKAVFVKLLQCENFIQKFFIQAVSEANSTLFFIFLDNFYAFVLMETELDTVYRNMFFQSVSEFLKKMSLQAEEPEEYQEKILIFFCVFVESLIFQKRRFSTFEEIFRNPDNSISLDVLFHEKKSPEYAIYFLTAKHFEAFVDVALENQNFQTKEVVINIFKLAYTILSSDLDIQYYFKEHDLDHKLFLLLNSVLYIVPFDLCELMFVLNLLLNMATGGEFYFLIEKNLFCKDFLIYTAMASKKKILYNDNENQIVLTQTLIDKFGKSNNNTPNTPILEEPIIQRTFDEKAPEFSEQKIEPKVNERPHPPFFFKLVASTLKESKSPIDSTSILLKQPIHQRTLYLDDASNTSPDRRSKKSFTCNLNVQNFPKSPLAQTLIRHHKRPSNLMATHYEREILIHQVLENYKNNFADITRYIRIKIPYFIDMIIRFLYEIPDLETDVKSFYINVLKNLLSNNECYNAAFIARDFVIMRLLLSLRLEDEDDIRKESCETLNLSLGNYMNNHQLKAIFNLMHYNLSLAEYCQSQLHKNKAKSSSRIIERCQLSALFTSELPSYSISLFAYNNYFNCTQSLLKMLLGLVKQSNQSEKPQKILNFSGQNSGVVFTNMRFPINGFSIILDLMFDNLLTTDIRELPILYHNNPKSAMNPNDLIGIKASNSNTNSNAEHLIRSNEKSFEENITATLKPKDLCNFNLRHFNDKIDEKSMRKEKYLPRIFSLVSQDSCSCLDVYINEKKELNIELLDKNRTSVFLETFKYKFEEMISYSLVISYNNDQFQVFLNNEELPSNKMKIPLPIEKFLYPKYFTLCCSPVKNLEAKLAKNQDYKKLMPLTIENSLSGNVSFFKLIDKAINPKEILIEKSCQVNQKSINLNIFGFLLKNNFTSENNWVSLIKSEPCAVENQQVFLEERSKSKMDFMNKLINKLTIGNFCAGANDNKSSNPIDNQPFDVKCKGVSYLEKISFLDFFLMFGNVEVFLFMVDLLATDFDFLDHEKSHAILLNIFEIIKGTVHKKEVEAFLKICGFKILSYLLNIYIQKRGCSHLLFDEILSFTLSFSSYELKNLAFSSLIFNFELYYICEASLQKKLVKSIARFFFTEGREVSIIEQKHRIFYLFYILSTFYPLDHALNFLIEDFSSPNHQNDPNMKSSDNLSSNSFIPSLASFNYMEYTNRNPSLMNLSRKNTVNFLDVEDLSHFKLNVANFNDLLEIRCSILKLLQRLIIYTEDPQIFKDHIQVLFQNIAKRNLGPTLKDFLLMLEKLLLKENKLEDFSKEGSNKNSQLNTPKGSPNKKKSSMKTFARGKTEEVPSFKLDSFDDVEEKAHNPIYNKQKSTFKSSRVLSQGLPLKFRDRDFLLKSIKLLDTCKLLVTILRNLKDQNNEFLCVKKVLEPEKYNHFEELDDFLTLVLNLLFNFLMEESVNEKDENEENMEISTIIHKSNQKDIKNLRKTYTFNNNHENSNNNNHQNRISKGRSSLNSNKILESLDVLIPEKIGPKTLKLFFDTIKYSMVSGLNFESILIMILLKRITKFSENLLGEFLKGFLNMASQNEEIWFRKLKDLPNFMIFLNIFYNNMLIIQPNYNSKTEENILYLESFINRYLFYLFYQENALKYLKIFILTSTKNVTKGLEISLNLVIVMMDKFLNESSAMISQWRNQKDAIFFDGKINQMLLNFIYFLNFIESLSYLCNPAYCKSPETLEILLKYLDKFHDLFNELDLIYMTFPEISNQREECDFAKLWDRLLNEAIKDEVLPRPGGIFHSLLSLLFNIINLSMISQIDNKDFRLKVIKIIRKIVIKLKTHGRTAFENSNLLFKKLFSGDTIMMEENFGLNPTANPFISNFNKNTRTSIEIMGTINRLSDADLIYSFTQQKILEILLYRVLELMTNGLDFETHDSKYIKEIADLIKEILENSETSDFNQKISGQALSGVSKLWKLNSSFSSSSSFKENNFKKEEFLEFGKAFNQEFLLLAKQKFLTFHENMPNRGFNDVSLLKKTEAFDFELSWQNNYSKSTDDGLDVKIELIDSLMASLNKEGDGGVVQEIIDTIIKLKEEIINILSPILYLNAYRPLKLVEKLACYRLKVYINQYQQKESKGEFPRSYVYSDKEDLSFYDTFQNCERDSVNINEKFSTKVQEFSEKEEILLMKTSKRWNYMKSQLMTSKGFWHVKASDKPEILKVDKQQDRYHRRFFLKPLKHADNNNYLSHEKKLCQFENNKKLAIRLSYCQDSPINRKGPLTSRKKSMVMFTLNPVLEKEEEQRVNEIKETIIEIKETIIEIKETIIEERTSIQKKSNENVSEEKEEESMRIIMKNEDSSAKKDESDQNSKDLLLMTEESKENQENMMKTRFTFLNKALEANENQIKMSRKRIETSDSQNTFQTGDNQAFIDNTPMEHSAQMIDVFHFKDKEDGVLEQSEEICGTAPLHEPISSLNRYQSEQLLDQKKMKHLDKNALGNRSASKVSPSSKALKIGSPKPHHKNGMTLYQQRNLQYSELDLKKFTDKEVQILENEVPLRESRRKRNSIRFSVNEHTLQYFSEKINLKGGNYGLIEITRENFIFRSLGVERPDNGPTMRSDIQEPPEGDPLYDLFPLGIESKQLLNSHCKKQWNLSEIISVQGRSYNLRSCAFELFTIENKAYFFNVYDPRIAEEIISKFQKIKRNKTDFFYNRDEAFKASGIQEKWVKGQISNFEYLSLVNTYAGRTYNDVNQYPVFPWILTDYISDKLDFTNPAIFRNLSLPVGGLLQKRLLDAREHYETLSFNPIADLHEKPFQYGTHYSGLGPVSYFLIRLEPFTSEHLKLQSGYFDDNDRLFASVGRAWEICLEQDFKELLPELFYLPDFLMNKNGFDFGKGNLIGSVELPNWAQTPYEFVFRHREALECEHVSRNLHNWIDLIFGFKQQGKAAVEADNVFRVLTYEGAVDLAKVEDIQQRKNYLEYITKLGQTPHQLLSSKHPQKSVFRLDEKNLLKNKMALDLGNNNIEKYEGFWDAGIMKVGFCSKNVEMALFLNNNCVVFISLDHHAGYGLGMDLFMDNQPKKVDLLIEKKKLCQIGYRFTMNEISPGSQFYFFKKKNRVFVMGGFCDGSLKIYVKGKEVKKSEITGEFAHKKPIISIGVCEECKIIACGSKDCRISLWKYDKDFGLKLYMDGGGLIYGHNDEIITLKINEVLDILFSVDKDGILLMHEIKKGRFIRKVTLKMERDEYVNNLDIHDNGLILIGTTSCRILLYSMNGDLIHSIDLKNQMKYNYRFTELKFLSKWNSYFAVADSEGEIVIYDAFSFEVVNAWNMKELLQERSPLNSFDIYEGEKGISLIYGFEKGTLLRMNLLDQKARNNLVDLLKLIIYIEIKDD